MKYKIGQLYWKYGTVNKSRKEVIYGKFSFKADWKIVNQQGEMHIALDKLYLPALEGLEGFGYVQIIWWFPYIPSLDRVESPTVPKWCEHWPNSCEASGDFDWESEFNF